MEWIDALSIVFALVFGATLGVEREISGKPAGIRTNALICVGAAIFSIVSLRMAGDTGDSSTRIVAQIVTGVGFLGAGSIIQDRAGVHGLTTAATIWLAAGIGMACGARFHLLAFISTVITIAILLGLTPISRIVAGKRKTGKMKKHIKEAEESAQQE